MFERFLTVLTAILLVATPHIASAKPNPKPESEESSPVNKRSFELNEDGIEAVRNKDFKRAEELFRRALSEDTHNLTAVFNLAGMYLNDKRQNEGIKLLDTYISEFPKDAGLFARRGDCYFSIKNLDSAMADYEQALKLEPRYSGAAAKLSTIYALKNKTKEAETMLLSAVDMEPKNAQLLQNLSNIFLINGKVEKAISTAKRGLQVSPTSELYVTLGNAYETQKDLKNSLIAFQRALDLGDKRPELKEKIESLKKVTR
ncbi:MAG: tetratricopeptide repeat protein [Oligoflexia bacterium]|nr:tetratricopeptide repeat protein [Oligoflexia bacterium]